MTKTHASRITAKGAIGLVIALAGSAYLLVGHARAQSPPARQTPPPASATTAPPPSEQINVEQTISFPYDI